MKNWNRFFRQCRQDLRFWIFCVVSLSVYRVAFLLYFRSRIDTSSHLPQILLALKGGVRYDSMAASVFVLFPFLLSVANGYADLSKIALRFRAALAEIFCATTAFVAVVTVDYFEEFNDQFDHNALKLYSDDTFAIFRTIWSSYHVLLQLALIGTLAAVSIFLMRRFLKVSSQEDKLPAYVHPVMRPVVALIFAVFLIFGMRGSLDAHTAQRKDSFVTDDQFLNKSVLNPYMAYYFALKDYVTNKDTSGIDGYLPDHDIRKAAQALFSTTSSFQDLDNYFIRSAPGAKKPPHHIFLIVMESYDSWPLMEQYASLHVTDSLKDIAKKGIWVRNFLPAGDGTIESLQSIITGLPNASRISNSAVLFPTALAGIFKKLGYKTRMFYGGKLTWESIGDIAQRQGFDEVYGSNDMPLNTPASAWGVLDEFLFDFIFKRVDQRQASFSLIMTTSYHLPYDIDVYQKGFPLETVPEDLVREFDKRDSLKTLGHLWYADMCIGTFVKKAEKRFGNVLFAFTGDHFSRFFINAKPDLFERSSVPFILYGRNILSGIQQSKTAAGSHLDIGPTLVELAAPKGFLYHAVGKNLLTASENPIGIGYRKLIGPDFIAELSSPAKFEYFPNISAGKKFEVNKLRELYNFMYAVGWWRIVKGPQVLDKGERFAF